jgi:hypothetical protein
MEGPVSYHVGVLDALQDYGFKVGSTLILLDGWETRGKAVFNPRGSVNHHTAGAATGVLPSLGVLVNGREGLPGPLCNCALDRLDRLWLIAAGGANHAGLGGWSGLSGNASVWGLEVEHVGTTAEPVGPAKWDAMYRFHAAVAAYSGFSPAQVCQHFEWAPTRKIDFVKAITNGAAFRSSVAAKTPSSPTPVVTGQEDSMYFIVKADPSPDGGIYLVHGNTKIHFTDQVHVDQTTLALEQAAFRAGLPASQVVQFDGKEGPVHAGVRPFLWPAVLVDAIPQVGET